MNQNMQIIEDEISKLQRLFHKDPKTLSDDEKAGISLITPISRTSLKYYSPLGRPIDFGIGITVRELCSPHVKGTTIGDFYISTVWIGHDMSMRKYFLKEGEKITPIIFETMIFKDRETEKDESGLDGYQARYTTIEEAEEGHEKAVQCVKSWVEKGIVYEEP